MLTWDAAKRSYRRDGRLLTQRQAIQLRNDLADAFADRFESLVDAYVAGSVRWARFGRDFLRLVGEATTAGYVFGRGGAVAMTDDDYATLLGLVTAQGEYARGFLGDIQAAEQEAVSRAIPAEAESDFVFFIALPRSIVPQTVGAILRGIRDQVVARAKLYVGAVVSAYERARAAVHGIDLPAYPPDGNTICRMRCRCAWEITETPTAWECYYQTERDKSVCATCLDREQRWAPFVIPR